MRLKKRDCKKTTKQRKTANLSEKEEEQSFFIKKATYSFAFPFGESGVYEQSE